MLNIDLQIRHPLMRMTFGRSKKQVLASLYNQTKYRKLRYQKRVLPRFFFFSSQIFMFFKSKTHLVDHVE